MQNLSFISNLTSTTLGSKGAGGVQAKRRSGAYVSGRAYLHTVLLTRKNVNTEFITKYDLKSYKKILAMTNAHLTQYQPDGNINITRGKKYPDIIVPLFEKPKGRWVESSLRRKWTKY